MLPFCTLVLLLASSVRGVKHEAQELSDSTALVQATIARETRVAQKPRFAVVRPFWSREIHALKETLLSQDAPKACAGAPLPVDLVLYYSGEPNATLEASVRSWLAMAPGIKECFSAVRVEYASVPDDAAYPTSPCTQFIRMFTTTPAPLWGYSAIFLMELDEQPLSAGWLGSILPVMEEAALGDAWVIGGMYNTLCIVTDKGERLGDYLSAQPYSRKMWGNTNGHVNGNAVYSASRQFADWMVKEWAQGTGGSAGVPPKCRTERGGAYDASMFLEARDQGVRGRDGRPRWRLDGRFMNCKPGKLHRTYARTMELARIHGMFPEAVMVHTDMVAKSARAVHSDVDWLVAGGNGSEDDEGSAGTEGR